jgi:Uma2 family endonuclease
MKILVRALGDEWVVRVQCAITTRDSEPEPDLVVAEGPEEKYASRHPMPSEVALVIEVADSSLEKDRVAKGRLYARARIEIYWIVNLIDKTVEMYTNPKAGKKTQYEDRQDYAQGSLVPLVLRGQAIKDIPVQSLLPSA